MVGSGMCMLRYSEYEIELRLPNLNVFGDEMKREMRASLEDAWYMWFRAYTPLPWDEDELRARARCMADEGRMLPGENGG